MSEGLKKWLEKRIAGMTPRSCVPIRYSLYAELEDLCLMGQAPEKVRYDRQEHRMWLSSPWENVPERPIEWDQELEQ